MSKLKGDKTPHIGGCLENEKRIDVIEADFLKLKSIGSSEMDARITKLEETITALMELLQIEIEE